MLRNIDWLLKIQIHLSNVIILKDSDDRNQSQDKKRPPLGAQESAYKTIILVP